MQLLVVLTSAPIPIEIHTTARAESRTIPECRRNGSLFNILMVCQTVIAALADFLGGPGAWTSIFKCAQSFSAWCRAPTSTAGSSADKLTGETLPGAAHRWLLTAGARQPAIL